MLVCANYMYCIHNLYKLSAKKVCVWGGGGGQLPLDHPPPLPPGFADPSSKDHSTIVNTFNELVAEEQSWAITNVAHMKRL